MYLKMLPRFAHRTILVATSLLVCAACDKDDSRKPFGWVKAGNRLYYDFYSARDTTRDSRHLEIIPDDEACNIREYGQNRNNLEPLFGQFSDIDVKVDSKGLREQICRTCSFASCVSMSDYLLVPKAPTSHQELTTYSCGSNSNGTNYVVNTDTTLNVPMGTFKVFVMQHPGGDRSYWNAREGLIMYQVRNTHHAPGTLRLNRIER